MNKRKNRLTLIHYRNWRYKNTSMLIISVVVCLLFAKTQVFQDIAHFIGIFGYIGIFLTGILFVSTFTVTPAILMLFNIVDIHHPVETAIIAGLGAVVGDYIIFRFIKDGVFKELLPLFRKMNKRKVRLIFKSPYFAWLLPVFGAIVIASPLPDELGVSMLGLTKINKWQFFALTYILNTIGILLILFFVKL